jgi:hypothetical protein
MNVSLCHLVVHRNAALLNNCEVTDEVFQHIQCSQPPLASLKFRDHLTTALLQIFLFESMKQNYVTKFHASESLTEGTFLTFTYLD